MMTVASTQEDRDRLSLADGVVDLRAHNVRRGDTSTRLTRLEVRLLRYLADHQDRPVSRAELLREVWNYAPGTRTRTVENTIRRLRRKIEVDPGRPRHILAMYGVGYRFEPLEGTSGAAPEPLRTNLALERAALIGRRSELARLEVRLNEPGIVVVSGLPGAGKTQLVRELARRGLEAGSWPGGAWFCDLEAADSEAEVERRVAEVLGLELPGAPARAGLSPRLTRALATGEDLLLVLDGADLVDPMPIVRRWLGPASRARIVVTRRLTPPLDPTEEHLPLGGLPRPEATKLLLRAARRGSGPTPDPDDPDLARIVGLVGGLPLPLQYLGARVALLGASEIVRREPQLFLLLRSPQCPPGTRNASLQDSFESVWNQLDPVSVHTLAVLAAGPAEVPLSAAERVLDLSEHPGSPLVIDVVHRLCFAALLRSLETDAGAILGLPPLLRAFAREQIPPRALVDLEARWASAMGRPKR